MESEIKNIELRKEYPCLMAFKILGEIPCGIYLVNFYPHTKNHSERFSVCLVAPEYGEKSANKHIGEVYFKANMNPEEWFYLPVGTEITLKNL
jgi:hypothetical protein